MTQVEQPRSGAAVPDPGRVVCPDGIERVLLDAAACALHRHSCRQLDRVPVLGRHHDLSEPLRHRALADEARAEAVPAADAHRIDPAAVGQWVVDHYPASTYPAVVLGSPHGAAVHLAATLGAAWLPTGFTVTVGWPGGSVGDWPGALDAGAAVARQLSARHPDVTVRQIHDPLRRGPLCGSTLTLQVRWRRLPPAYRDFLQDRVAPGGASLLLRDLRTWPVLTGPARHSFQVGSPVGGWKPGDYTMDNPSFARLIRRSGALRWPVPDPLTPLRYAEPAGEPELELDVRRHRPRAHRALYRHPEALSACVADVYREHLRAHGRAGDRCVVECERQLDPWQVLDAGLVPYWCESASRRAVSGAEWWLAGSRRFDVVDVLPAPPGVVCDAHAGRPQWRAVASFARHRGEVSKRAMRHYPMLPLPTSHAADLLHAQPRRHAPAPAVGMAAVLDGLRSTGRAAGVLVL